jgi:transposase
VAQLAAHKVDRVRQAIKAAGTSLLDLPPYSPGLKPDRAAAKLEALLRKAAARSQDALGQTIGRRLDTLPESECSNYLTHGGCRAT